MTSRKNPLGRPGSIPRPLHVRAPGAAHDSAAASVWKHLDRPVCDPRAAVAVSPDLTFGDLRRRHGAAAQKWPRKNTPGWSSMMMPTYSMPKPTAKVAPAATTRVLVRLR